MYMIVGRKEMPGRRIHSSLKHHQKTNLKSSFFQEHKAHTHWQKKGFMHTDMKHFPP